MPKRFEEQVTVRGRWFILTCEGPVDGGRYEVFIRETLSGRPLTRAPVRGRSPDDARDRAFEVMHTMMGIESLQEAILAVAAELAPGARVELTEDARAIHADLAGAWALRVPFAVSRDEVVDPAMDLEELRARIRAHFVLHLVTLSR